MKLNFKIYLLCLLSVFLGKLVSQNKNDSLKTKPFQLKHFMTSIEGGPQYCYRLMNGRSQYRSVSFKWHGANNIGSAKPDIYYDAKNDKPGIGWAVGLYGNFKIYKGLRVKFGLSYENFKYKTGNIDTLYITNQGSSFYPDYTDKRIKNTIITYDYNFYYLNPFELKYYHKLSRKIYLDAGIGASILVYFSGSETGVTGFSSPDIYTIAGNNNISFRAYGNLGINYFFNKHLGVLFQTYFQQSATRSPVYGNMGETIRLYSIGGKIGVLF